MDKETPDRDEAETRTDHETPSMEVLATKLHVSDTQTQKFYKAFMCKSITYGSLTHGPEGRHLADWRED